MATAAINIRLNINRYEESDSITNKAPIFDGENFEFWKDKVESFFLGFDENLWDIVIDGYIHPTNVGGMKIDRRSMDESQKI